MIQIRLQYLVIDFVIGKHFRREILYTYQLPSPKYSSSDKAYIDPPLTMYDLVTGRSFIR